MHLLDSGVIVIVWISITIFLLVTLHKHFQVFYFGGLIKGLIKEVLTAGFISLFLTVLLLYVWWLAALITIGIGLNISSKTSDPAMQKVIMMVFVILAIIVAIAGFRIKKQAKDEADAEERQAEQESMYEEGYEADYYQNEDADSAEVYDNTDYDSFEIEGNDEEIYEDYDEIIENEIDEVLYYVIVNAPDEYVNVRLGPGTDYNIIGRFDNGEELAVVSDEGSWLEIAYYDNDNSINYGYVAASQVARDNSENSDSVYICEDATDYPMNVGTLETARTLYDGELPGGRTLEQMIVNEIYARHGYIFKAEELQNYFETKSWYSPKTNDMDAIFNELSDTERGNIDFLKNR